MTIAYSRVDCLVIGVTEWALVRFGRDRQAVEMSNEMSAGRRGLCRLHLPMSADCWPRRCSSGLQRIATWDFSALTQMGDIVHNEVVFAALQASRGAQSNS
jgi:hypothetical protein